MSEPVLTGGRVNYYLVQVQLLSGKTNLHTRLNVKTSSRRWDWTSMRDAYSKRYGAEPMHVKGTVNPVPKTCMTLRRLSTTLNASCVQQNIVVKSVNHL